MSQISDKYNLPEFKKILGKPTNVEQVCPDGVGYYQHFQGGSIYFHPNTGAHVVWGAISAKWFDLGAERGFLGYPLTDELTPPDGRGRYNHFQGGSIYWTPETGAHEVHGHIRNLWANLGWEKSFLGYPLTDETATPDGRGRYNHFQGGSIYWTPETGAHEVHGYIRNLWASLGWEKSWLGYPTSDEFSIPGTNGRRSVFVDGVIDWYPGGSAQAIKLYGLQALDWCCSINRLKNPPTITFLAIVKNIGPLVITGPGHIATGVTVNSTSTENPEKIGPDFKVNPGETEFLGKGIEVVFNENYIYRYIDYVFHFQGGTLQDRLTYKPGHTGQQLIDMGKFC